MLLLFKIFLLVSLVRSAVEYPPLGDRPLLLAGLFTLGAGAINLFEPSPFLTMIATAAFVSRLLLSWLYFKLIDRWQDLGLLWWLIVFAGLPLAAPDPPRSAGPAPKVPGGRDSASASGSRSDRRHSPAVER